MNTSAPAPLSSAASDLTPVDNRTRGFAIALFVAAVIVLVGLFSHSWFTPERGSGGIGLTGVEVCYRGECKTASWGDLRRAPGDIKVFGWLGLISGVAAVGAAGALGGLLLAGRGRRLPLRPFQAVLGVAAFSTTMFFMRVFGEMSKDTSIGYSGLLVIGGLIAIGALATRALAAPSPASAGAPLHV